MDQRERLDDFEEAIRLAMDGRLARVWTALPAKVVSFDATKLTCVLQPTIQGKFTDTNGKLSDVTLPNLLDCPVVFPGCAGFLLTLPLAAGDEGLVVFSSRCIDNWWAQGGVQSQFELRMHDLSDGFFMPGCFSKPNVPGSISTSKAQLRSKDGNTLIELGGGNIHMKATTVTIDGDAQINGKINATGEIQFGTGAAKVTLSQHQHAANNTPPTPGH